MRCTRKQVAARAGVSQPVVSYVLNGTGREHRISETTINRVMKAARDLGYQPNIWGKILKTQRSGLLALVSQDLTDPNTSEIIKALGAAARAHGFGLALYDLAGQETVTAAELAGIETGMAEALLLHAPSHRFVELCDGSALMGKPVCVIGRHMPRSRIPSVEVDNARGAAEAVRHLLEQGISRLGIIADRKEYGYTQERLAGCRKALEGARRVPVQTYWRAGTEDQFQAGVSALAEWRRAGALPDGVFAMGDVMACGALRALNEQGASCPGEVKVVGFDGTPLAQYASPPLSTVSQPFEQMAEAALDIVGALIEKRRPGSLHRLLAPSLVVRASSASGDAKRRGRA